MSRGNDEQTTTDLRWSRGVRLVLDWLRPLDELRREYEHAAELVVMDKYDPVWVRCWPSRDPFGGAP